MLLHAASQVRVEEQGKAIETWRSQAAQATATAEEMRAEASRWQGQHDTLDAAIARMKAEGEARKEAMRYDRTHGMSSNQPAPPISLHSPIWTHTLPRDCRR